MTIKQKIIGNTVGSALLVAAVGVLSAVSMLRIGSTLRFMQATESGRFRDVLQLESAAPGTALLKDSLALERDVRDEMMRGLRNAHDRLITSVRLLIAAAALAIILSLGLGLRVAMPLAARLARLRDGAVELGKGRRQGHVEVGARDEIGQLAQAFNEMADGVPPRTRRCPDRGLEVSGIGRGHQRSILGQRHQLLEDSLRQPCL